MKRTSAISGAWATAIGAYVAHARAGGSPKTTITTRRQHLERAARRLVGVGPWEVTGEQLVAYVGAQVWATETRRAHRTTLRTFYAWAVAAGWVETSPALALPMVRPSRPRPRPTPERAYRLAAMAAGPRERLILRLAAEAGLRRAEIAQVHSRDLLEDLGGWSLVVHGKGGRERVVPLPDSLSLALRTLGPGWAFPGDDGGHLSPRWVGTLATRLLPEPWTLHTLRHRFATMAYDVDRDVFVVQELLGHASPVTTRAYVAVTSDRLRETVRAIA